MRAMAKWPNVPVAYGWLNLDRRGRWSIKVGTVSYTHLTLPTILRV